jgi:hypothetical protein
MKSFLILPEHENITVNEYDGQPHSLYTLFASILVDSHDILHQHSVYAASEAFEKGERPFFLGEKLLFGPTVVTGKEGFEDIDAFISETELARIVQFEVPRFYRDVFEHLPKTFSFDAKLQLKSADMQDEVLPEWVLYAFNMADGNTKRYFLNGLEEAVVKGESIELFLTKMGEAALKAMR